jgi:hypothetical protein
LRELQDWLLPLPFRLNSIRDLIVLFLITPAMCFAGASLAYRQRRRIPRPIAVGLWVAFTGQSITWLYCSFYSEPYELGYFSLLLAWWLGIGALPALFLWIFTLPSRRSAPASTSVRAAATFREWTLLLLPVTAILAYMNWHLTDQLFHLFWNPTLIMSFVAAFCAVMVTWLREASAQNAKPMESRDPAQPVSALVELIIFSLLGAVVGLFVPVVCFASFELNDIGFSAFFVIAGSIMSLVGARIACALR